MTSNVVTIRMDEIVLRDADVKTVARVYLMANAGACLVGFLTSVNSLVRLEDLARCVRSCVHVMGIQIVTPNLDSFIHINLLQILKELLQIYKIFL